MFIDNSLSFRPAVTTGRVRSTGARPTEATDRLKCRDRESGKVADLVAFPSGRATNLDEEARTDLMMDDEALAAIVAVGL